MKVKWVWPIASYVSVALPARTTANTSAMRPARGLPESTPCLECTGSQQEVGA